MATQQEIIFPCAAGNIFYVEPLLYMHGIWNNTKFNYLIHTQRDATLTNSACGTHVVKML